jgi:cell wall-associated NlpC family hydrolase
MSQDFPVPAETAKAPKGSVARLIQIAKSQVGYIEGPKDNETKYGAYTKANFQPWCGSFVNWCANEAGVKIPNTVYTPGGAAAFKKAGAWIDGDIADPEPGDIAYFDFPSDGVDRISHVGIVIEDNEDGTVWCIEGNTSSKKSGSQRNGGEACKQLRAYKKNKAGVQVSIVGFGRPKFKVGGAAKPAATADGVCPTCGK